MNSRDSVNVPRDAAAPTGLGLVAAALLMPGMGLSAAALNMQWGARPVGHDAFGLAWWYVNVGVAANWFLLWPAVVFRATAGDGAPRRATWIHLAALIVAVIPALSVAAYLAEAHAATVGQTLMLQALFAAGCGAVLARRWASQTGRTLVAGTLATLLVVLPVVVYLQAEFLPGVGRAWAAAVPLLALHRVTTGG